MFAATIRVTLRKSILDPQGKAVEHAIGALGISGVVDVRIGKHIELVVERNTEEDARNVTEEICKKLLANPVMEDYTFEIARRT